MSKKRVPLYERLPEIYRIRDEEQVPPGQLKHYLALVEEVFGEIHKNIEELYSDLFIETCDDWVIPYIGDLMGVSHLDGDAWTLRADVADTIALRRRKGTLASIERLTYNLTQWGIHCVELRENLVWNQHLNHQRPDEGGYPPYSLPSVDRFTPIRGGTLTLRDPAHLTLLGTPFDPFAHVVDVKPPAFGNIRYNLPHLGIFLWRLQDYRIKASKPMYRETTELTGTDPEDVTHIVRFNIDSLGRPVRLFNTYQYDPDKQPPVVTQVDETPGPIPTARLSQGFQAGQPEKYLAIDTYNTAEISLNTLDIANVGLQFHLPVFAFEGSVWPIEGENQWKIRGANLCAWEAGLLPAVSNREVIIDPVIGRVIFGVSSTEEVTALVNDLLVTYTYGAVGTVGAHPVSRSTVPEPWNKESVIVREVSYFGEAPLTLNAALSGLGDISEPVLIEIKDSFIHVLDLDELGMDETEGEIDGPNLHLSQPLMIRAADGQRPIIQLKQPLRFRPTNVSEAKGLIVRFEGLYLTRHDLFTVTDTEPLIARAAVNKLEIIDCTLDPGGFRLLDGERAPSLPALRLSQSYGFTEAEREAFDQTPEIIIQGTITGSLRIDESYKLSIKDTIIDAGENAEFAVAGAEGPESGLLAGGWGPPTTVEGITVFGRMRVRQISGKGGIWVHTLEVLNNQKGCIKYSYFSGQDDRLPQHHACVDGREAKLHFSSDEFGNPAYAQLAHTSDFRIRERGPRDDAMGAFGFLMEAHKWRNLQIRYREFMPVGVRPLLVPVT